MTNTPGKSADILIIDDCKSDTMLMEEAIKSTSVASSVHVVHDAPSAIKFLNKKEAYADAPRPDLILLDIQMPDFDGHEFLRVVKTDPLFLSIPIIILTTSTEPEDIAECYRLHANCFIQKPVNFIKFKKVVSVITDFWFGIATLPPKH
jgi:CheY-like chemotaxis protein